MDTIQIIKKISEVITSFQNSSMHLLSEKHFAEFEQLIHQLPDEELKKTQYFQQAGEALSAKMIYDKAEQYFEQGLSLARHQKNLSEQALALGALAELERVQGKYRAAFSHINTALDILTKTENDVVSARLFILAGLNDISLGMHKSAAERFYKAYVLYRKMDDKTGIALALIRLGTAEMMQENYEDAEKHLQDSLVICNEINDKHLKAGALTNLGEIYRITSDCENAYKSYHQASELFEEMGLWRGVAITMNNMAHISVKTGESEKAKEQYAAVFEIVATHALLPEMMDTLAGIALLLNQHKKTDLSRKIAQRLINVPALLDESKLLLQPLIETFHLEAGQPVNISTEELQSLFKQAMEVI